MPAPHYASLLAQAARCVPLGVDEAERFVAAFEPRRVSKREIILRAGDAGEMEAFVAKGCMRTFAIDEKGKDITLEFATEEWWIGDLASLSDLGPSRVFIEAMEDSELLVLSADSKSRLLRELPGTERIFRMLVQRHLATLQQRIIGLMAERAATRYEAFLERYPRLSDRVPQHHIASYLGITPAFLSRLRARRIGKG